MRRLPHVSLVVAIFTGLIVFAFPYPWLTTVSLLFAHAAAGVVLIGLLVWHLPKRPIFAWVLAGSSAIAAIVVLVAETGQAAGVLMVLHGILGLSAALWLIASLSSVTARRRAGLAVVLLALFAGAWLTRDVFRPASSSSIANDGLPTSAMAAMAGQPDRPFYPSFAAPADGAVPAAYFLDSERCRDCHAEIYEHWSGSAHHFASLNNQWYLAAFADIQQRGGPERAKWCAGCHDQALLFTGLMSQPAADLIRRPEAHVGVACVGCHGIAKVNSTLGQGDYTLEFTALHALSLDGGPGIRTIQDAVLRLAPEIHRRTFLKPFLRAQPAEFCSACHKVHLDRPLNDYRWLRGFNEFDTWQRSGVSGNGVAAFYFPDTPRTCVDCHMPETTAVLPDKAGPIVRSHRFAAANTALPMLSGSNIQAKGVEDFLRADVVDVDIFALYRNGAADPAAPLDQSAVTIVPGDSLRVDVVVRNRGVGHAFPGGTADAADAWLELSASDDNGVFFASGLLDEDGNVDDVAHRYRTVLVDGKGQRIDRRNAWESRALVYNRVIGPGAAEVVRYRIQVPSDAIGPITLTARLNYRKFQNSLTEFAFANSTLRSPAANRTDTPELPVVVMAEAQVALSGAPALVPRVADWERWNDYGIGLLMQGDLIAAKSAFLEVTQLVPDLPDGWTNLGRIFLKQGVHSEALIAFDKALSLDSTHPAAAFFRARAERAMGSLEAAAESLAGLQVRFPNNRMIPRELGRIRFLQERYAEAVQQFRDVLDIDPEDANAHYNLALAYRAQGSPDLAEKHEALFQRFKTDEAARALAADYRRRHPAANLESQPVHEHGADGALVQ